MRVDAEVRDSEERFDRLRLLWKWCGE